MDGASKFVKGDAIAGVLILSFNIVGGIILGMASHGLSISEAAQTYIVLAIGDALVAQIPALLLSIAAASIVTRVNSEHDLSGQIASPVRQRESLDAGRRDPRPAGRAARYAAHDHPARRRWRGLPCLALAAIRRTGRRRTSARPGTGKPRKY
jgi:hypothetical protein